MSPPDIDRRRFIEAGGALAALSLAAPLAVQTAAAATATNYKALVCVFLVGGNDGHNTVLATDSGSWSRYFAARNTGQSPIALMPPGAAPTPVGQISAVTGRRAQLATPEAWGGVLPIVPKSPQTIPGGAAGSVRTFALHPFLAPLQALFNRGRLAVVANLGTLTQPITKAQYQAGGPVPAFLFSHLDQQHAWQSTATDGVELGWGGQMADSFLSGNGANALFTAVAPLDNALFLSGRNTLQYVVDTGPAPAYLIGAVGSGLIFNGFAQPALMSAVIQNAGSTSDFANDHAAVVTRSIQAAGVVNAAVSQAPAALIPAPPAYVNPITGGTQVNPLAQQLQTVARMIAAAPGLGIQRQVFCVTLGSFDSHQNQNLTQPNLLAQLAQAMAYFDAALSNIGGVDLGASVTTFTASDFGRTFTTNGTGTDHAWGGHHFVMGGAVKGGDIYGQYPTVGIDLGSFVNPDMSGNALVPTLAVDQYAATLGGWFGVPAPALSAIFPNLGAFGAANLGFV